jgi:hypothetical protein
MGGTCSTNDLVYLTTLSGWNAFKDRLTCQLHSDILNHAKCHIRIYILKEDRVCDVMLHGRGGQRKTWHSVILSIANPVCAAPELKPGLRYEKSEIWHGFKEKTEPAKYLLNFGTTETQRRMLRRSCTLKVTRKFCRVSPLFKMH